MFKKILAVIKECLEPNDEEKWNKMREQAIDDSHNPLAMGADAQFEKDLCTKDGVVNPTILGDKWFFNANYKE